jgi:hypothetical protein
VFQPPVPHARLSYEFVRPFMIARRLPAATAPTPAFASAACALAMSNVVICNVE